MKKTLTIWMLFLVVMMLSACAGTEENQSNTQSNDSNTLVMSWPNDIGELNPHLYSPNEMFAQAMVYDPLITYNQDGTLSPGLAETWEISEDGKTYTLTLRENVLYSDGSKLTAGNVKRNIDTVINNIASHSWLESIAVIDQVSVVDDSTVIISLKEPYAPFLQELALIRPLRMLGDAGFPGSGHTADGIKEPIGTGPWVLTEYDPDRYAKFTRNENYWGDQPSIEHIEVKFIADSQLRIMSLEKGEIDLIYGNTQLVPSEFIAMKQNDKYITKLSDPLSTRNMSMNSTNGVTRDREVRLALQHAFNRQAIVTNILSGLEKEAQSLFAPGFPAGDIEVEHYSFDLKKSKQILDEAGWVMDSKTGIREKNGETLELVIAYDSSEGLHKEIFEYLQGAWKEIGVDVRLIGEESQVYYKRTKSGDYNIVMNDTWGAPYDPFMYLRTMLGEQQIGHYALSGTEASEDISADIRQLIRTTEEAQQEELFNQIIPGLQQEAIFIPISYTQNYLVANDVFDEVKFSPQQYEIPFNQFEMK